MTTMRLRDFRRTPIAEDGLQITYHRQPWATVHRVKPTDLEITGYEDADPETWGWTRQSDHAAMWARRVLVLPIGDRVVYLLPAAVRDMQARQRYAAHMDAVRRGAVCDPVMAMRSSLDDALDDLLWNGVG